MFTNWNWGLFAILWIMGLFGTLAVLPYAFVLQKGVLANVNLSLPKLVALSLLQSAVLLAIAVGVGLLAAQSVGLGAPVIAGALAGANPLPGLLKNLPLSVAAGIGAGLAIVVLEYAIFLPHLPASLRKISGEIPLWKRALTPFYGGIVEEILIRLFLFSAAAWLLARFWQTPDGLPTVGVFWAANILAALVFGLGHLPATAAVTPLTPLIILRALVLNGLAGVIFGYLYWQHGLETAMLAHFTGDVVIHVLALPFVHAANRGLIAAEAQ